MISTIKIYFELTRIPIKFPMKLESEDTTSTLSNKKKDDAINWENWKYHGKIDIKNLQICVPSDQYCPKMFEKLFRIVIAKNKLNY